MKKLILALLLSSPVGAQIPTPQIPLTGNIGCSGFPCLNNGTINLTSDASHTMTAVETSALYIRVTSSVSLTATRTLYYPAGNFPVGVENATTGGQVINVCPISGACVPIPNSTTTYTQVWYDGTNFVQIGSTGGGGGSPGGNANDIQTSNGTGGFAGTAGLFQYNPSRQNLTFSPFYGSTPGYNIGGSAGSSDWQMWSINNLQKFSQGIFSGIVGNSYYCQGNGDCNIFDTYTHMNSESNDANGESLTLYRNYFYLGDTAYVGTISGSSVSNTQIAMSTTNNGSYGNGRIAIVDESAQALTITGLTGNTLNGRTYATLTVTGATYTPSVTGTLSNNITISHTASNSLVAETLNLTSVSGSGCAVNDLLTLLPFGADMQIETVRVTSAGAVSGGAQSVGVNMRNSQAANSLIWCHGPQDLYADTPSIDVNGVKMLVQVLGAAASNQLVVARQTSGSFDFFGVQSSGTINVYSGARLINAINPGTGVYDGLGFTTLSDNNSFTTGTVGNHIEVADGNNQQFWGWKTQAISNNPNAQGSWYYNTCPSGSAACGDLNSGTSAITGNLWVNQNPNSNYNCSGCGGPWNLMPLNYIKGPYGPLAYYFTAPVAPTLEYQSTTNFNPIQIDDDTAYLNWNKSTHTWTLTGANIDLNGAVTCGSGCGGSSGISGQTAGVVPLGSTATTIGAQSHINENTAGLTTVTQPLAINDGSGNAGYQELGGNTGTAAVGANSAGWMGPHVASFTAYALQLPSTGPTASLPILSCGTPTSGVSTCTFIAGGALNVNGSPVSSPNLQNNSGVGGITYSVSGSNIQASLTSTAVTTSTFLQAAQCNGGVAFATGLAVYDNNAPPPGCSAAATSTAAYLAFQAAPSLPQYAEAAAVLPAFWTSSDITVLYTAASATSGTFILEVETACPANSGSTPGTPSFGTASTVTVTVPGTAGQQGTASITGIATAGVNGCPSASSTPSQLAYRIFRSPSDTATGNIQIGDVILTTHRSQ